MGKESQKNGFSLIELIIAIAILVVLTGLLAPQFMKYIEKSRQAKMIQKLDNIYFSFQVACIEALESEKVNSEEKISIGPGKISSGGTPFEATVYSFLKESLGEDEMEKISILAQMGFEGDDSKDLEDKFNYNNILIQYYPEPDDPKKSYYFRMGYDGVGGDWAIFRTGTYGEFNSTGDHPWK